MILYKHYEYYTINWGNIYLLTLLTLLIISTIAIIIVSKQNKKQISLIQLQIDILEKHNQQVIAYLNQQNEMIFYIKQYIENGQSNHYEHKD